MGFEAFELNEGVVVNIMSSASLQVNEIHIG
jgi:hypothetical protein